MEVYRFHQVYLNIHKINLFYERTKPRRISYSRQKKTPKISKQFASKKNKNKIRSHR